MSEIVIQLICKYIEATLSGFVEYEKRIIAKTFAATFGVSIISPLLWLYMPVKELWAFVNIGCCNIHGSSEIVQNHFSVVV